MAYLKHCVCLSDSQVSVSVYYLPIRNLYLNTFHLYFPNNSHTDFCIHHSVSFLPAQREVWCYQSDNWCSERFSNLFKITEPESNSPKARVNSPDSKSSILPQIRNCFDYIILKNMMFPSGIKSIFIDVVSLQGQQRVSKLVSMY